MNFLDELLAPSGRFQLWVWRNGVLVEEVDEQNLIVDGSKQLHARLLGGDVTNRSITQIAFGTNGTAPVGGNTAITGAFTKAIDGVSYPAANQVAFAFSLATGENNGMGIWEFGLLAASSVLYARRARASVLNKDTDLSFSGLWTISF